MKKCPYCNHDFDKVERCQRCGWGPQHWPWQYPSWETVRIFSLNVEWLKFLYQLLLSPRFFFRQLDMNRCYWRSWYFALPFIFLMLFMTVMLLPRMILSLPENLDVDLEQLFETLIVPLSLENFWMRSVKIGAMCLQSAAIWFVFLTLMSSFLHLGLTLSGSGRRDWFKTFKLSGYVIVPMLIMLVMSHMMVCLDSKIGFPREGLFMDHVFNFYTDVFKFLMIIWPYFMVLTALEEVHKINRMKAQIVVLISVVSGFLFLSLFGQVFGV